MFVAMKVVVSFSETNQCLEPCVQDTCVALQALSEYAILSYVGGVNLTISLASTNLDFQETFELNRDNKKLLQSARVMGVHRSGGGGGGHEEKAFLNQV